MVNTIELIKQLDELKISRDKISKIINIVDPNSLDWYLYLNFNGIGPVNLCVPSIVFYDFVKIENPGIEIRSGKIGRSLRMMGVVARNKHIPELGRSIMHYYLSTDNLILLYQLTKYNSNYDFQRDKKK